MVAAWVLGLGIDCSQGLQFDREKMQTQMKVMR
jgi:hypothetical protein